MVCAVTGSTVAAKPLPTVVDVHGGPLGAWAPGGVTSRDPTKVTAVAQAELEDAAAAAVHGAGETLEHGTSRFDEGRPRVARSGIAGNAREPARRCRPPPVGGRLHPQGQGSGGRLPHREDVPTPAGG